MTDKSTLNNLQKDTSPPDRGSIARTPNIAPEPPGPPPLHEAASQSGQWPVHDPLPRAQEARRGQR